MLKRLGFIGGLALIAALIMALPASALNFRNGYITVTNATTAVVHARISHEEWGLSPKATVNFNDCCYAAGTKYLLTALLGHSTHFFEASVTPRLCSKNGSPYGYAHLVVHDNGHITRVDTRCP